MKPSSTSLSYELDEVDYFWRNLDERGSQPVYLHPDDDRDNDCRVYMFNYILYHTAKIHPFPRPAKSGFQPTEPLTL